MILKGGAIWARSFWYQCQTFYRNEGWPEAVEMEVAESGVVAAAGEADAMAEVAAAAAAATVF